ncbi:hypothetical protein K0T92_03890 [Paenibacillus oenotherae]|uniref:Hint domain-containing protein n=1 Tax=Paenibacillus oenotherae TaxID=1435645 RepID=A0ABS7D1Q5_9BACL|nr:polymorphic toxin-type HINT domain-containing protein [Paenibacillus oenotherae]MBW7473875.1 hypothetical protein [Paenibacillus oenotherae]
MFKRIVIIILAITFLIPSLNGAAEAQTAGKTPESPAQPLQNGQAENAKPAKPAKKSTIKQRKETAAPKESRMKNGTALQAVEAQADRKELLRKQDLLPSERSKAMDKLPAFMKQIMAYFYPAQFDSLQESEKLAVLSWGSKEVNQAIASLSAAQLKQLEALAPVAIEHRDFHQDKKTYKVKHAPLYDKSEPDHEAEPAKSPKKPKAAQNVSVLSAPGNGKYVYRPFTNEYNYKVNTDDLVDPIFRTANRTVTDLSLAGKPGLDLNLIRTYNSLGSQVLEPHYISRNVFQEGPGEEGDFGNFGEKPDSSYQTGFIATGWQLNLPQMEAQFILKGVQAETVACATTDNPCQQGSNVNVQTSGYQTNYKEVLLDTPYEKIIFTLEDGSSIEFRDRVPYRYPYKDAAYSVNEQDQHILSLQGGWITYTFSPTGEILSKKNALGDQLTFTYPTQSRTIITDSYGRTITLYRTQDLSISAEDDKWVITGFDVRENNVLTRKIQYDVTRAAADLVTRTWTENNGEIGLADKHIGYWQLDRVRDLTAGNHTLESYEYYPIDNTRMADFNLKPDGVTYRSDSQGLPVTGSCADVAKTCFGAAWSWEDGQLAEMDHVLKKNNQRYGEIAYLLLNKVKTLQGLTIKYNYQSYNANWDQNTHVTQQEQYRGTTRLYQDKNVLQYFGYHAIERIDYLYQQEGAAKLLSNYYANEHQDHGWTYNEYWKTPKQSVPRLQASSRFGDKQTIREDVQRGESTETSYRQYRIEPKASGYLLKFSWNQPWNYMVLQQTESNVTYTNADHLVSAYEYPPVADQSMELLLPKPSKIYQYAGQVTDHQNPPLYQAKHLIEQTQYDDWGQPLTITDAIGNKTSVEYEGPFHQVSRQTMQSADQKTSAKTETVYYPSGHAYRFLPAVRTQSQKYPNPMNTVQTQEDVTITDYSAYSSDHQVLEVKEREVGGEGQQTRTAFTYTPSGQLQTETVWARLEADAQPSPITLSYEYDAAGRLTKEILPDSSQTTYAYDDLDRIRSSVFIPGDGTSGSRSYTIQYDDANRVVAVHTPEQEKVETAYTPFGLVLKEQRTVDGETRVTLVNKTNDGQQISAALPYGESTLQTSYTYDSSGRPRTETNSIGQETQFYYSNMAQTSAGNEQKETVQVIYPDGKKETSYYNRFGQLERLVESSPEDTRTTLLTYTPFGQVSRQDVKAAGSSGSEVTETTRYSYDAAGNLTYVLDAAGHKNQYVYNHQGQVIMTMVDGKLRKQTGYNEIGWKLTDLDGEGRKESYKYFNTGLPAATKDRNGLTRTFAYTPYMELSRSAVSDGTSEVYWQENQYDPSTRLLTQTRTSENETLDFSYDKWQRMRTQQVVGRTYTFSYDAYDRLEGILFPDQKKQVYTYDSLNRIQTVQYPGMETVNYTYTTADNEYEYKRSFNGSSRQSVTRNAFDELIETLHSKNNVTSYSETFTHDGFSNMTGITKLDGSESEQSSFTYDLLNRIQWEETPEGTSEYQYDGKGSRVINKTTQPPRLSMGERNLTYNAMDMLSRFEQTDTGTDASYTYYGDGLRATKNVNGTLTRYVYVEGQAIEELDGSGNVKARNIWGNELLWRQDKLANKSGYYWYNGHGDVIRITDASGTEINRYAYDIWGNVTEKVEGMSNPFRYTGEIQDDESGYIYLRARYYDPTVGRFTNEDTYEGENDDPLSQNLYTYVNNNPLKYTDPTGNLPCLPGMSFCKVKTPKVVYNDTKKALNFLFFDDLRAIFSSKTTFTQKGIAILSLIPIGKVVKFGKITFKFIKSNGKWKYASGSVNFCNCFTAGTKVLTDEGEKNIEDIEVGDMVLAKDEETGEFAYKEVTHLYRNDKEITYELTVGDQVIETTDNHPFWVEGKGWILAVDLQVGDKLQQSNGNTLRIDNIKIVKHEEKVKVYNFTVADFHTYFVSDLGIWVHNIDSCGRAVKYATDPLANQLDTLDDRLYGMWNKGSFDTAGDSLIKHFKKHGSQVGAEDLAQYIRKAEGFAQNLRGATKSYVDGAVDGVIRYKKNGKYIDIAPDGTIISFGK